MLAEQVTRMRFRRAPMAAAALWFALGIGGSRWVAPAVWWVALGVGVCGLLAWVALVWNVRWGWLPVAGVWVLAGLAAARWEPRPAAVTPLMGYADGLSRTVRGHVTRVRELSPAAAIADEDMAAFGEVAEEPIEGAERAASVDVAVDAVEYVTPDISRMVPMGGGLRATMYGADLPALDCGDAVELTLQMKLPERFLDPGAFQYADRLLAEGISVRGSLRAGALHPLGRGGWGTMRCRLDRLQGWAAGRMERFSGSQANRLLPAVLRLDGADAAMLDAMLFGDRSGLNHALRVGFERTGSFHLFVVSGLHVALLAAGVFWGLRRLKVSPWAATGGTLAVAAGYAVLTGFGQPVQRALAMTCLYLVARLLSRGRDGEALNSLGAAALGMLVWSPTSLFTASFQMTVLAVVAIAGIAGPLGERSVVPYLRGLGGPVRQLPPRVMQMRMMVELWGERLAWAVGRWAWRVPSWLVRAGLWVMELALIGVVAELVMVLPMALYFHRAAVFAVPANMVVIPVIAVLAPAAVATFAAALVSPWVAWAPGAATALLLHGVRWGIGRLSHLAGADVRVPGPVWWIGLIAVAGWVGCAWAVRRGRWQALAAAGALPVIAVMVLWPEPVARVAGVMEVSALDVGQGDSLLVVGPDGRAMLVDAGGPVGGFGRHPQAANFDVGEEVVSPYLWSRRVRRLDVVALTHAHSDHMGGLPAVLRSFRPRELWVGIDPGSAGYAAVLREAAALGIRVRHLHAGDGVEWGSVQVSVLSPAAGYRNVSAPKNDDSLVMRMQFGAASALLEGDAERRSEEAMVAAGLVGPVTLLKVGHHGSLTSTTPSFLAAASPRDAVISVGRENGFGHPRREVVDRLLASGAGVYRTDQVGLTTFLLGRDGGIRVRVVGSGE